MKKRRQISPERKALYYGGMVLSGIGFLVFISVFFSAASGFGDAPPGFGDMQPNVGDFHGDFEGFPIQFKGLGKKSSSFQSRGQSMMFRAISGMVMIGIGGVLMKIGAKGPAGAGIILDPEQKRRDLEPWNRATGGMIKDGLDEAGINLENVLGAKTPETDASFGDKLRELHRLYEEGILSQEEYEREKRDILDKI